MPILRYLGLTLAGFGLVTGAWGVTTHRNAGDNAGAIESFQLWAGLGIASIGLAAILLTIAYSRPLP